MVACGWLDSGCEKVDLSIYLKSQDLGGASYKNTTMATNKPTKSEMMNYIKS